MKIRPRHLSGPLLAAALALVLASCSYITGKHDSTDVQKLKKLAQFNLDIASAHWEVLPTPEAGGLVPGPTDFHHLMAELTLAHAPPAGKRSEATPEFIAPNAGREWLDPAFRDMLAPHEGKWIEPSKIGDCEALSATYTRTRIRLDGFICRRGNKALVYLPLTEAFKS